MRIPRLFSRFTGVFLTLCLLADSNLAAALTQGSFSSVASSFQNPFANQALAVLLTTFARPGTPNARATARLNQQAASFYKKSAVRRMAEKFLPVISAFQTYNSNAAEWGKENLKDLLIELASFRTYHEHSVQDGKRLQFASGRLKAVLKNWERLYSEKSIAFLFELAAALNYRFFLPFGQCYVLVGDIFHDGNPSEVVDVLAWARKSSFSFAGKTIRSPIDMVIVSSWRRSSNFVTSQNLIILDEKRILEDMNGSYKFWQNISTTKHTGRYSEENRNHEIMPFIEALPEEWVSAPPSKKEMLALVVRRHWIEEWGHAIDSVALNYAARPAGLKGRISSTTDLAKFLKELPPNFNVGQMLLELCAVFRSLKFAFSVHDFIEGLIDLRQTGFEGEDPIYRIGHFFLYQELSKTFDLMETPIKGWVGASTAWLANNGISLGRAMARKIQRKNMPWMPDPSGILPSSREDGKLFPPRDPLFKEVTDFIINRRFPSEESGQRFFKIQA
jgi:hypothetical protein